MVQSLRMALRIVLCDLFVFSIKVGFGIWNPVLQKHDMCSDLGFVVDFWSHPCQLPPPHHYQTLFAAWEHVSLLSVKWLTFHHTGLHIVCHIIIAFGPFSHPSQFQGHHLALEHPQFPTHQPLAVLGSDYFFSKKSRDMRRHA